MSTSAQTLVVPELKHILFATDFLPCSEAVLPLLRSLALCCGSTIHVVHVVPPLAGTAVPLDATPELDTEYQDGETGMRMLFLSGLLSEVACTSTVQRGDIGEILSSLAEEKHAGLIVLGTHGRRGVKKLVLGSTAEQVIRTAPCPVLTVGPNAYRGEQPTLGPILVAIDFDLGPHPALHLAASLARANHVPLILVHAVPPSLAAPESNIDSVPFTPTFSAQLTARALSNSRAMIEEMISAEQLQDLKPQIIVEVEPPADLIVATAEKSHAGMVVMGAHRARMYSVASHFPGATASEVLCEAPCPVMTIRD